MWLGFDRVGEIEDSKVILNSHASVTPRLTRECDAFRHGVGRKKGHHEEFVSTHSTQLESFARLNYDFECPEQKGYEKASGAIDSSAAQNIRGQCK